ncbi:sugar transferase [Candidatus Omnitrophota bacterium]
MKKTLAKNKKILTSIFALLISLVLISSAFATLTLIKHEERVGAVSAEVKNDSVVEVEPANKRPVRTRAPEPQTMVLFGGGFLGMLMSFVRRTYNTVKRVFDVVSSIAGFIILSPILLIVALMVKLTSKGPILYSQVRVGLDGAFFRIYKFRTMRVDAEDKTGPIWAAINDNRLTPIGAFLRKAHLDELPQLINVLRSEMSVIGPRPERPKFVEEFEKTIPHYAKRLTVKPGITGLAQVWHRYDTNIEDVKKKLKYDLLYIKKICFWTDFNIILRTFRVVITGEGAH